MNDNFIKIENLSKSFFDISGKELLVCDNFNFSIARGTVVSILGPSGCGKTTLLKLIAGLLKPYQGTIWINGMNPNEAKKSRIYSYLTQNPVLLPWLTVKQNVQLPGKIFKDKNIINKSTSLLGLVDLNEFIDSYPNHLSGGMQSRVALARAYSTNPQLLLLDEPFGALDAMTRTTMQNELQRIFINLETTIILITHSIEEAIYLSDKVIVLSKRPSKILKSIDINFDRPRNWEIRNSEKFLNFIDEIRNLII